MQTSGAMRRENAKPYLRQVGEAHGEIQYSEQRDGYSCATTHPMTPSLRAQRSNPSVLRRHGLLRFARNDAEGRSAPDTPHVWDMTTVGATQNPQAGSAIGVPDVGHAHVKGRFRVQIDND